ncbi:MAG: S8 family peptidase, partial [Armatimonadetes bacterium]|nr:S8 family peptidase [Armatimonadota bacterium]
YDDYGHGTHIAGIIAGTGKISQGRYSGIAPESKIVGLKVDPIPSQIIKAISWAVKNKDKYNIKIINLSFGSESKSSYQDDILAKACEIAVKNGLIVVVAAGNDGPNNGTINSPGIDPLVITVGNLNDKNTITPLDDEIDFNSSRGPTPYDGLPKPDLIARGTNIISALAPNSTLANEVNSYPHIDFDKDGQDDYLILSGSSMATAMVSGIIALLLQANPKLTPNQIKFILMSTAKSLKGHTIYDQGAGVIDPASSLTEALNLKSYYQIT